MGPYCRSKSYAGENCKKKKKKYIYIYMYIIDKNIYIYIQLPHSPLIKSFDHGSYHSLLHCMKARHEAPEPLMTIVLEWPKYRSPCYRKKGEKERDIYVIYVYIYIYYMYLYICIYVIMDLLVNFCHFGDSSSGRLPHPEKVRSGCYTSQGVTALFCRSSDRVAREQARRPEKPGGGRWIWELPKNPGP